jgi:hypothetical protein
VPAPHALLSAPIFHTRYNAARAQLSSAKLDGRMKKMKKVLFGKNAPKWLEESERQPPFTAFVRNIDADMQQSDFGALFETFQPLKVSVCQNKPIEGEKSEFSYAFIEFPVSVISFISLPFRSTFLALSLSHSSPPSALTVSVAPSCSRALSLAAFG